MKTPCIKICKLENEICIGCLRTIKEIKEWRDLTDDERECILQEIDGRIAQLARAPHS